MPMAGITKVTACVAACAFASKRLALMELLGAASQEAAPFAFPGLLPAAAERAEQVNLGFGHLRVRLGKVGFGSRQRPLGIQHCQ